MNKHGVALAADSAVTISVSSEHRAKIFNSVDKLFKLSNHHPVAIMIYGSASFMRIPWETIIKQFRKQAGDRSEAALEDYGRNFIDYLRTLDHRKDHQLNFVEQWHVAKFLSFFKQRLLASAAEASQPAADASTPPAKTDPAPAPTQATLQRSSNPLAGAFGDDPATPSGPPAAETAPAAAPGDGSSNVRADDHSLISGQIDTTIDAFTEQLQRLDPLDYMQGHQAAEMLAFNTPWVDQIWHELFATLPVTAAQKEKILSLICGAVARDYFFSENDSGIVIAGFGEKELYPVMLRCNFEGHLFGRLKYGRYQVTKIDDERTASVTPFAQGDEIYTFIQGIDPGFMQAVHRVLMENAQGFPQQMAEILSAKNLDSTLIEEITAIMAQFATARYGEIETQLNDYARKKHVDPIVDAVAFLPKDELAHLAESLVTLTSVRKRMSTHTETVGGPVDVAIISKGDGFIWIKRKNYFNPELNRHLFNS